jgi:hypothetical protein
VSVNFLFDYQFPSVRSRPKVFFLAQFSLLATWILFLLPAVHFLLRSACPVSLDLLSAILVDFSAGSSSSRSLLLGSLVLSARRPSRDSVALRAQVSGLRGTSCWRTQFPRYWTSFSCLLHDFPVRGGWDCSCFSSANPVAGELLHTAPTRGLFFLFRIFASSITVVKQISFPIVCGLLQDEAGPFLSYRIKNLEVF